VGSETVYEEYAGLVQTVIIPADKTSGRNSGSGNKTGREKPDKGLDNKKDRPVT